MALTDFQTTLRALVGYKGHDEIHNKQTYETIRDYFKHYADLHLEALFEAYGNKRWGEASNHAANLAQELAHIARVTETYYANTYLRIDP